MFGHKKSAPARMSRGAGKTVVFATRLRQTHLRLRARLLRVGPGKSGEAAACVSHEGTVHTRSFTVNAFVIASTKLGSLNGSRLLQSRPVNKE